MNEDLQRLHDLVIAQHQALFAKLDDTSDVDEAKMILAEMQEILHRIDVLQGLLFRETTTALRSSLTKVDDANTEQTKSLKSAGTAVGIIKVVVKFLTVVDRATDL